MTAACGLVNSNAKCQVQPDKSFGYIGLTPAPLCQQLFLRICGGIMIAMVAKIVDDLLITGQPSIFGLIIEYMNERVQLRTVV